LPKTSKLSPAQLLTISKALADPRRQQILKQIGQNRAGVSCANVRECQSVTAPTLSHHIKELESAGLVCIERRGKFAHLTLQRNVLDAYIHYLATL